VTQGPLLSRILTVYKFQKGFNEKTSQVVLHLEVIKKQMEAACIKLRTYMALLELIRI